MLNVKNELKKVKLAKAPSLGKLQRLPSNIDPVAFGEIHATTTPQSEEVASTNNALSNETVSTKPIDVQGLLNQANTLRSEAAKDWQQLYVTGRNATKRTMQKVYSLFYEVMHYDEKDKVIAQMKAQLPEKKIRKNTKETAIFIRYVFEDFDDKQVHVYSTSLDVGYENRIEPNGFSDWVDGHPNGFEGIRANAANAAKAVNDTAHAELWKMGMGWAKGAAVVETIKAEDWDEDELCRILIAVPNGDDTANVKDTEMMPDQVKAVLALYSKAVKERNKPKGKKRRSLTTGEKNAKTQLKGDIGYQEQLVDEYRFNLSHAKKRGHVLDIEESELNLCLAQAKIVGLKASINALGARGAEE